MSSCTMQWFDPSTETLAVTCFSPSAIPPDVSLASAVEQDEGVLEPSLTGFAPPVGHPACEPLALESAGLSTDMREE